MGWRKLGSLVKPSVSAKTSRASSTATAHRCTGAHYHRVRLTAA
ncbi:hypothetical protein Rhow_001497 [Rhodococcus wratislaviensis]|uniref:Uncharacterized protein n=1 Tax=Rhodococcus wratislaviensis TaxID=44752 RepID=A0A402C482_RHOWR|nr:hypothetical protein Rhow_001497 [Rhodococcus wratislaviensis]